MGTWGFTAFEDDTALEFYNSFCVEKLDINQIEELMTHILQTKYNMDELLMEGFYDPTKALVMAEILAKALGNETESFPDEEYHQDCELPFLTFDDFKESITQGVLDKTIAVIRKIQTDDEMHYNYLWSDSGNLKEWVKYSNDLVKRLRIKSRNSF